MWSVSVGTATMTSAIVDPVVVFDGGEDQSAELVRRMICAERPVRFVDMRTRGLDQVYPALLKSDRNH
jgi:hypothetical protein